MSRQPFQISHLSSARKLRQEKIFLTGSILQSLFSVCVEEQVNLLQNSPAATIKVHERITQRHSLVILIMCSLFSRTSQ
jgi:hypothetical protein